MKLESPCSQKLPECDGMCSCWHEAEIDQSYSISSRDRTPVKCKNCGIIGLAKPNETSNSRQVEWFTKGEFDRCEICDSLVNDYFEGFHFYEYFVCSECGELYPEDDLLKECEHESAMALARADKMADRSLI